MNGFSKNLSLNQIFLIVFLISAGYIVGSFTTIQTVQETSVEPKYNLTCPEPVVKVENQAPNNKDELRTGAGTHNYIQNPETNVMYQKKSDSVEIEVDAVSKPEGMSMRPSIFSGNTLLLTEYDGETLEAGQIIRYSSSDGGHVIHRIRASYIETEGYLLLKGDNTDTQERVEKEDVTHIVHGVLYT